MISRRDAMALLRRWKTMKYYPITKHHGVWFGIGWQSEITWPIERAWLTTVLPPYLHGSGLSFALYHLSVRVGVYKQIGDFEMFGEEESTEAELAVLGWESGNEVVEGESYDPGEFDRDHWAPPLPEVSAVAISPAEATLLRQERDRRRQRYVR